MNDSLHKEIDLIQSCISRMAQNSFMVKGWLITLITVVLALLPENIDAWRVCIAIFVTTFCFWFLDAFYLKLERLFRWKYDWVINKRQYTNEYLYDLNPRNMNMWLLNENNTMKKEPNVAEVMFTSLSIFPIYIPILLSCTIVFIIDFFK